MMKNKRLADKIFRIANVILADKTEYIYDPDHKKRPGGGYVKTERGWSLKKKMKRNHPIKD